jgi:hypothetical protein
MRHHEERQIRLINTVMREIGVTKGGFRESQDPYLYSKKKVMKVAQRF